MILRVARSNVAVVLSAAFMVVSSIALGGALALRSADQARIDDLAKSTNDALCTFKNDLQRRADGAREFLRTHPDGFAGLTRTDLQRSIDNQQATLRSLTSLNCKED